MEDTIARATTENQKDIPLTDVLAEVTEDSARGGFFLFSGAALGTVIMAVAAILVGRLLGPELYGQYNLVLVIPLLLLLFTDFGINAGITKFAASLRVEGKTGDVTKIIRHGFLFRMLVGFVVLAFSMLLGSYFALLINRPDFTFYVQIASISIIFQVLFGTANSAFVGLDMSQYTALTTNVQAAAKTILQIVFVLAGFGIVGALTGYVGGFLVASVLGSGLLFLKLLKPSRYDKPRNLTGTVRFLVRFGMPLYISVILTGVLPLYQQVVLAFFSSDADIGNFRAAGNFVTLLAVIPTSITTALLPAFSKLDSSSTEKVNLFFKKANKYTCLLIVPTTTLIMLFSKQIVELVYGSVYSSAPLFLSINSLIYFLVAIGHLSLTSMFTGLGETKLTLRVTMLQFFVLLGLSPVFAAVYNVTGAIIAYVTSATVASSYAAYIATRKLKVDFDFKSTLRIYSIGIVSCIPSVVLLWFTSLSSMLALTIGTITYLFLFITLMPVTGIMNQRELGTLTQLTRRIPLLRHIARPLIVYQRRILNMVTRSQ